MRLTFVLPYAGMAGGIRVIAVYANRLKRRGHEVAVVSVPKRRVGLKKKLRTLFRERRCVNEDAEPSQFDGTAISPHVIENYRAIVDGDVPDADAVVATFWRTGPWVAAMSPSKGAKAIFLQGYETSPNEWSEEIDSVWRLPLHKIVCATWLKQLAASRFGDHDVDCVPNSVETEVFNAARRGRQQAPTVGFLYNQIHLKGVDVVLAALDVAKKALPGMRAIAFGAEPVSRDQPLPGWIEFHYRPTQSEIRDIYRSCDVWICGSRQEGFHLPPLEAMACRCPVVSTRVGGPQDIINPGVNGFLVDVQDHEGLARRTLQVLAMEEEAWRAMSDAAVATATPYSWDDATDRFELALTRLVGSGSRSN